jgi:hypothetical protein
VQIAEKAYLPKLFTSSLMAGFLTCLTVVAFPSFHGQWLVTSGFSETYSSGYCAGLSPASLSKSIGDFSP